MGTGNWQGGGDDGLESGSSAGFSWYSVGDFWCIAYFYSRNYKEQRDFRAHMYEITNELDKNLSRNCTLTQNISDSIAVIPELRQRVARLEGD